MSIHARHLIEASSVQSLRTIFRVIMCRRTIQLDKYIYIVCRSVDYFFSGGVIILDLLLWIHEWCACKLGLSIQNRKNNTGFCAVLSKVSM